jgi:cytochrome P450
MAIISLSMNPYAVTTIPLLFALYIISLGIYRLFLSPLAKIPGPRLAALTYWYEFYYECILPGRFLWKIKELHAQYGPIVRINPNEVHINDIEYYDTIYTAGGSKHPRNKVRHLVLHDDSMFDTYDAALHRKRRTAVASPFSKQSVRALEPAIREIIDIFAQRLTRYSETGEVVDVHALWNSLTQEVIGQYCFGTDSMKSLREGRDDAQYLGTFNDTPLLNAWGRMFPWFFDVLGSLPYRVLAILDPRIEKIEKFDEQIGKQINAVLAMDSPHIGVKNVFHEMRDSKHLPAEDKRFAYYKNEAVSFIGGGTETTAASLTTLTYWLLARPNTLRKLRDELKIMIPDGHGETPSVATLESLPYLVSHDSRSRRGKLISS